MYVNIIHYYYCYYNEMHMKCIYTCLHKSYKIILSNLFHLVKFVTKPNIFYKHKRRLLKSSLNNIGMDRQVEISIF